MTLGPAACRALSLRLNSFRQDMSHANRSHLIANLTLGFVGVICLGLGMAALATRDVAAALAGLGAGAFLIFGATIDRFELMEGLGLKAKTRKLDETIQKATAVTAELKVLAEVPGATLISLASKVGRYDAAQSQTEAIDLAEKVRGVLMGVRVAHITKKRPCGDTDRYIL